ncbi:MAG: tRNA (cytidine(56)-2'-O)-methyltransferase [Thermoplasmata archaeon]
MRRLAARRSGPAVTVLRIGHRPGRDPRLTTHLGLAARALGAERMLLNPPDGALAARLDALTRRWGGSFPVLGVSDWKRELKEHPGEVVHLTMYGQPMERLLPRLKRRPRLLIVVGGAKVPHELYRLADFNVAVGHQPHSEVAALAILLDRLGGVPGPGAWPGATQVIVPRAHGKCVRTAPGRRDK